MTADDPLPNGQPVPRGVTAEDGAPTGTDRMQRVRAVLQRATAVAPGPAGLPQRRRRLLAVVAVAYTVVVVIALFVDRSGTVADAVRAAGVAVVVCWVLVRTLLRRPVVPAWPSRPWLQRSAPAVQVLYWALVVVWLRTIVSASGGDLSDVSGFQYVTAAVIAWLGWHGLHGRWPPAARRAVRQIRDLPARARPWVPTANPSMPRSRTTVGKRTRHWYRLARRRAGVVGPPADRRRRVASGLAAATLNWLLAALLLWANAGGIFGMNLGSPVAIATVALVGNGVLLAWRGFRPTASEALANDRTRMILYLRSFVLDGGSGSIARRSHEQRLARGLTDIGQLVAIGDPAEGLPQLGALRLYESDADWQTRVEALMGSAAACVVQCLPTAGVAWELGRCVELVDPSRLVLFVPDAARNYPACRTMFGDLFPGGLPPAPEPPPKRTAFAVIAFDETWRADIGIAQSHDLVNTIRELLDG